MMPGVFAATIPKNDQGTALAASCETRSFVRSSPASLESFVFGRHIQNRLCSPLSLIQLIETAIINMTHVSLLCTDRNLLHTVLFVT